MLHIGLAIIPLPAFPAHVSVLQTFSTRIVVHGAEVLASPLVLLAVTTGPDQNLYFNKISR